MSTSKQHARVSIYE